MRTRLVSMVVPALMIALVGAAHADRKVTVAALSEPPRPSLATGELRLTGAVATPAMPVRSMRLGSQLEAAEIEAEVAAQRESIERCYLSRVSDPAKAGQLDVLFEIGRDGRVRSVAAAAPGLTPYSAPAVTKCIRAVAAAVQFPARRNDTTVVLPYLFQKTIADGAGPQLSCWSAKGCH